jgi:hypothetical protein
MPFFTILWQQVCSGEMNLRLRARERTMNAGCCLSGIFPVGFAGGLRRSINSGKEKT